MLKHNRPTTILNPLGFEVEPRISKRLLNFRLQKYRFLNMCGQPVYIHQLPVLPLIYDLMGNSTHMHVGLHVLGVDENSCVRQCCQAVFRFQDFFFWGGTTTAGSQSEFE